MTNRQNNRKQATKTPTQSPFADSLAATFRGIAYKANGAHAPKIAVDFVQIEESETDIGQIRRHGRFQPLATVRAKQKSDGVTTTVTLPMVDGLDLKTLQLLRAQADLAALRTKLHNPDAPTAICIPSSLQADFGSNKGFEQEVEDIRCSLLGTEALKGAKANIDSLLQQKFRNILLPDSDVLSGLSSGQIVPMYLWQRLSGLPLDRDLTDPIEGWAAGREAVLRPRLANLKGLVADQAAFANGVQAFLQSLAELDGGLEDILDDRDTSSLNPEEDTQGAQPQINAGTGGLMGSPENPPNGGGAAAEAKTTEAGGDTVQQAAMSSSGEARGDTDGSMNAVRAKIAMDRLAEQDTAASAPSYDPAIDDHVLLEEDFDRLRMEGWYMDYPIFTRTHDEVIGAEALADATERRTLRAELDKALLPYRPLARRLARRLQRRLMAMQQMAWDFQQDDGQLDTQRLTRFILNPTYLLRYRRLRNSALVDTAVCLLLDNSGSMRGLPITITALCADMITEALEQCGIHVEVLGFTTKAWRGGAAREAWLGQGKLPEPGRLNDLRHIVYKAAGKPWRRSKDALGVMFKDGILKENIDGEALIWAHQRLMNLPYSRRIMMVISDGAPVDDSTLSVNTQNILERHLRYVIRRIEGQGQVELSAIGIGHDVGRYYHKAITMRDVKDLPKVLTREFETLFTDPSHLKIRS